MPLVATPDEARFEPRALLKQGPTSTVMLLEDRTRGELVTGRLLRRLPGLEKIDIPGTLPSLIPTMHRLVSPGLQVWLDPISGADGTWIMTSHVLGYPADQAPRALGTIGFRWAMLWMVQLLDAIRLLHSMKPAWIVGGFDASDVVLGAESAVICDLGLFERIHGTAMNAASPPFLAPEVKEGHYSMAGDLYSVGAVGWFLLVGEPPGEDLRGRFTKKRPDAPPELMEALLSFLDENPARRPFSAEHGIQLLSPWEPDPPPNVAVPGRLLVPPTAPTPWLSDPLAAFRRKTAVGGGLKADTMRIARLLSDTTQGPLRAPGASTGPPSRPGGEGLSASTHVIRKAGATSLDAVTDVTMKRVAVEPPAAVPAAPNAGFDWEMEYVLKSGRVSTSLLVRHKSAGALAVARRFKLSHAAHDVRARLEACALELANLQNPGLPEMLDVFESADGPGVLNDFVVGWPLDQVPSMLRHLDFGWMRRWLDQMTEILIYLHSQRLAVGCLEPSDVVVTVDQTFLVDLQIFERAFPDTVAAGMRYQGHPFVAPERRSSQVSLEPGDVYCIGALGYWMVTHSPPEVRSVDSRSTLWTQLWAARPDMPQELATLIIDCLTFHPGLRPTLAAVRERLAAVPVAPVHAALPAISEADPVPWLGPQHRLRGPLVHVTAPLGADLEQVEEMQQAVTEAVAARHVDDAPVVPPRRPSALSIYIESLLRPYRPISGADRVLILDHLSVLLRSGVPMMRALEVLQAQQDNPRLADVLEQVAQTVSEGRPLSAALRSFPRVFSNLQVAAIEAAETAGGLDNALARLARTEERNLNLTREFRSALTYPAFVLGATMLLIVGLGRYLFAQLVAFTEGQGVELPWMTQALMATSKALDQPLVWMIGLAGTLLIGQLLHRILSTPAGRQGWHRILLRLPLVGRVMHKLSLYRMCDTMAVLLQAGIPLLCALEICSQSCGLATLEDAVKRLRERVMDGLSPDDAMALEPDQFSHMVKTMTSIGLETGSLPPLLQKTATLYEDDALMALRNLTTILGPACMLVLGIIVAVIIVAAFAPIYSMMSKLG